MPASFTMAQEPCYRCDPNDMLLSRQSLISCETSHLESARTAALVPKYAGTFRSDMHLCHYPTHMRDRGAPGRGCPRVCHGNRSLTDLRGGTKGHRHPMLCVYMKAWPLWTLISGDILSYTLPSNTALSLPGLIANSRQTHLDCRAHHEEAVVNSGQAEAHLSSRMGASQADRRDCACTCLDQS